MALTTGTGSGLFSYEGTSLGGSAIEHPAEFTILLKTAGVKICFIYNRDFTFMLFN
jgi:hypothetical protein